MRRVRHSAHAKGAIRTHRVRNRSSGLVTISAPLQWRDDRVFSGDSVRRHCENRQNSRPHGFGRSGDPLKQWRGDAVLDLAAPRQPSWAAVPIQCMACFRTGLLSVTPRGPMLDFTAENRAARQKIQTWAVVASSHGVRGPRSYIASACACVRCVCQDCHLATGAHRPWNGNTSTCRVNAGATCCSHSTHGAR